MNTIQWDTTQTDLYSQWALVAFGERNKRFKSFSKTI